MNCRRVRHALTGAGPLATEARRHLGDCAECSAFAERLAAVERALGEHRVQVSPPQGFAERVTARLPREDELIGWAASRLLPATVCVLILLSWLNLRAASERDEVIDPTDAVLTWVVDTEIATGGDP